ncbi:MAG: uroporphyrinogen decarboxylase family protein [Treponema sp.]|jgi:uroporphyrinogen decarboxylase|nr:uroporphyrinogen decarboxylase family protein [Treponema sp.]
MTAKETIHNACTLQATERQPAALFLGGSWALYTNGIAMEKALAMPPGEVADILFQAYRSSGTDIVWAAPGSGNLLVKALGGKLKFRPAGPPDIIEAIIKNSDDIDHIDVESVKKDPAMRTLMEITKHIVDNTSGVYAVGGSMWGPLTMAGLLYGAESLMRDIRRNKEAVHRLLSFTADLYLSYVEGYIKNGVDIIAMGEPTASGDMISREHFAEFAVPALKKIYTALGKKNVITGIHICGNTEDRLDLIAGTGAQFVSLDYKVSLQKARSILNGKMAFAGNMDPVAVIQHGTLEEVARACEQCIASAGAGPGFILMPGCDIPPATPPENIRAMTQLRRSL